MERIEKLLAENLNEGLKTLTVSRPRHKDDPVKKLKVRPVLIKDKLMFQLTSYKGSQVIHENLPGDMLKARLIGCLRDEYAQLDMETCSIRASALVNRKGSVSLKVRKNDTADNAPHIKSREELRHDRSKSYIIKEGEPVGYLVDLGVMTPEGRIVKSRYDKFRQINRFLEYVEDVAESLPGDREIRIIDCGYGKSYLTFAIYHYLSVIRGMEIRITGLDLKEDVIEKCNGLAVKYGYDKLEFICGDIADYDIRGKSVDMVVTLHACDTATDYALYNALRWGAGVILSVPCCQHEVNGQIDSQLLKPVMKYGILKERASALITDGVRAELLAACGYDVQLLEFIDMEHTPKNIMIRAVKKSGNQTGLPVHMPGPGDLPEDFKEMLSEMKIRPALYRLLFRGQDKKIILKDGNERVEKDGQNT